MSLELALCHLGIRANTDQIVPDIKAAEPAILNAVRNLSGQISSMMGALGVGFGISQLLGVARDAIHEAEAAVNSETKLRSALEATGNAAGFTADQLVAYASELQATTTESDEAFMDAMTTATTFSKVTGDNFKELIKLSAGMGVRMGGVGGAVRSLGRALEDPVRGMGMLRRAGIMFDAEEQKKIKSLMKSNKLHEAQGIILAKVRSKVGNMATDMAKSPAGQLAVLRNQLSDVKEELGKVLLPVQGAFIKIQIEIQKVLNVVVGTLGQAAAAAMEFNSHWDGLPLKIGLCVTAVMALGAAIRSQIAKTTLALIFSGWGLAVVGIGLVVGALIQLGGMLASLKTVQDAWAASWAQIKQALVNLWTAISTAFMQMASALDAALGGPFAALLTWLGIAQDKGESFAVGIIGAFTNMVLNISEWITALAENWKLLWDNMGKMAMFGVSYLFDIFMNLGPFISQAIGYALNRVVVLFIGFLKTCAELLGALGQGIYDAFAKLPELIKAAWNNEDLKETLLQIVMQPLKSVEGFGKGLMGEAPDVNKLFEMSNRTKKQFDNLGKAFDPIAKRKKELEEARDPKFGMVVAKEVEKVDIKAKPDVEAWKAVLDPGRFGFADFGKKFQDELLKQGDDKVDKQIELAAQGVQKQDEMLKKQDELIAAVEEGGGLAE